MDNPDAFDKENDVHYVGSEKRWYIKCSVCGKEFPFEIVSTDAVRETKKGKNGEAKDEEAETDIPEFFSITCTNEIEVNENGRKETIVCGTQWAIRIDVGQLNKDNEHVIIERIKSKKSENDKFWLEWGTKMVTDTLEVLDKRAESMLTVIAALIAVEFGLVLAFGDQPVKIFEYSVTVNIFPQAFLALSAAFFSLAYFPKKKHLYLYSPKDLEGKYRDWLDYKVRWHKWAYRSFVTGLVLIALSYVISPYTPPETQIQTINGNLNINASGFP